MGQNFKELNVSSGSLLAVVREIIQHSGVSCQKI